MRAALANARRVVVLEKAFSVGAGGIVGQNVRDALAGSVPDVYDVVGGLGGRPITKASLHRLVYDVLEERLEPARLHFLDLNADLVEREPRAHERRAALRVNAENILRDLGVVAAGSHREADVKTQQLKLYQVGTFAVGNRLLDPDERTVQARTERSNTLTSGHRACRGCGEALGARYVLDAAMRATEGKLIAANATGCSKSSTPYPESSWQLPRAHSLFANAPAVAAGVAAALEAKGRTDVRVIGQGRRRRDDGHRLRLPVGMFERGDDAYVCYDNEAYMNTGVQRSSATPPAARTANTKPVGNEPGNVFGQGTPR